LFVYFLRAVSMYMSEFSTDSR